VFPTAADQTVAKAGIYRVDETKLPKTKMPIKYVELNDEWESYMIRYTVFYPMDDSEDYLTMESDRTGMQVLKMERTKEPSDWMQSKYGQQMRPWECIVKIPNTVSGDCGQFEEGSYDKNLFYSFSKKNNKRAEVVMEREPKRMIDLENPKTYKG